MGGRGRDDERRTNIFPVAAALGARKKPGKRIIMSASNPASAPIPAIASPASSTPLRRCVDNLILLPVFPTIKKKYIYISQFPS